MDGTVREAHTSELLAVVRLLEGALLETDPETVRGAIENGDVLVVAAETQEGRSVRGALVLDGRRIESVAVRRCHRGRGIGSALVRTAVGRRGTLVAEFRPGIRPFYESLGFEIETDGERCRGRLADRNS